MKILVTGSTASQVPNRRTEGTSTFTRLLVKALSDGKNDVTWINPSVSLSKGYLSEFDQVVVGIAPPTSTAAHRIYGTLSTIFYAKELGNLSLLVDAPEPKRVWAGIRAIYKNPDSLTKEFYSKRQEYKQTLDPEVLTRLHSAISYLYEEEWPTTLFPAFPWMSFPSVSSDIPNTGALNLTGLNFDHYLLENPPKSSAPYQLPADYWVSDAPNTKWSKSIEQGLNYSIIPVRKTKWESNETVESRIFKSLGSLISVYRLGNPWWSVVLPQSLSLSVPVATDWKLSSMLGSDWSVLPGTIEDLSDSERVELATSQKISYVNALPSRKNSIELATSALKRK